MKGLDRITSVRLAEVLSQSGLVGNDRLTEALYEQDSTGTAFVEVLIETGEVPEWEIAKAVVQHFQLPYVDIEHFDINPVALAALPEDFLFEYRIVPLDVAGNVLTVSMPVMSPFKVLAKAQDMSGKEVFPVVGLCSTNQKVLQERFPHRPKAERRSSKREGPKEDKSWENIFDIGDQEVLRDLNH